MLRRIIFAALCGAGITSLLSLALQLSYVSFLALLLLYPGGLIQALLLKGADSALAILIANFVVYSALTFVITSGSSKVQRTAESGRVNLWLAFSVGVLVCLACIPTLDPLWPTGMTLLARREAQLHEILPLGMDLEEARRVLRSQGIVFGERVEESDEVVLTRPGTSISATAGDRVVFAQIQTNAGQFPCGYRIDVVLVFGKQEKLRDRFIHRFPICP
jgi:hypothetical protein